MKPFVSIPLRYQVGIRFLDADIWYGDELHSFVRIRFPKENEGAVLLDKETAKSFGIGLLRLAEELK